jgi:FtsP/CotA-like multicopper oxidase with cupredoxin domain
MKYSDFVKRLVMLVLMVAPLALMGTPSFAQSVELAAVEVQATMPDASVIPMWGFIPVSDAATFDCTTVLPTDAWNVGPTLTTTEGGNLTINVKNCLSEDISVFIPGQLKALSPVHQDTDGSGRMRVTSFDTITAPNAVGSYQWTGVKEGTYLYHSGTHLQVQVQMGLYGALVVEGASYPAVSRDEVLLYSEIDPALHEAVDSGTYGTPVYPSTFDYNPQYFLINAKSYPETTNIALAVDEVVLLRFVNAGLMSHVPTLQGSYMKVIAEDGNLYPYPKEQYSIALTAAKTMDAEVTVRAAGTYGLYDRCLHLGNAAATGGGMLTYLVVGGGVSDSDGDGVEDAIDNCGLTANGPLLGTCVVENAGVVTGHRVGGAFVACGEDADCGAPATSCQMVQGDFNSNGCGDVCECLGDADNDGDVDGSDAFLFKVDFGRRDCSVQDSCPFDFSCDEDTDGSDAFTFKLNFGKRFCPSCVFACTY